MKITNLRSCFSLAIVGAALFNVDHGWAAYSTDHKDSADRRAEEAVKAMTIDEKISLLHTQVGFPFPIGNTPKPDGAVGSAGYAPGVPRLGISALQESDASMGVANPSNIRPNDNATALPSSMMLAATFDPDLAYRGGKVIGTEAHAKGINVML